MTEKAIDKKILLETIIEGIENVKGEDISILDFSEISNNVTDYFIICNGNSTTQVSAIAASIERHVKTELKERPWHIEGTENNQWVLLDYISIVVHIFLPDIREYYDIENLWGDVKITKIPNKTAEKQIN